MPGLICIKLEAAAAKQMLIPGSLGKPAAHLPAGPRPAKSLTPDLGEQACWGGGILMDFHRLIKVQLGPGAKLYLSARYLSQAAQAVCVSEAIWPGWEPDFDLTSPHPGSLCSCLWGPGALFRSSILQTLKPCLQVYLKFLQSPTLANGSQSPGRVAHKTSQGRSAGLQQTHLVLWAHPQHFIYHLGCRKSIH